MNNLDHFLKERFGLRWQVLCYRLPRRLPGNIDVAKVSGGGGLYEYRLTCDAMIDYDRLVSVLRSERQLFTATIVDRPGRLAAWVNRPGSRVMDTAWAVAMLFCAGAGLHFLP